MQTIYGYIGIFAQPFAHKQYGSCMYALGNPGAGELIIVLLTPGNFMDAYKLAKEVTYQHIHIFPTQLDLFHISDIYRLVVELRKTKQCVTIHYPTTPNISPDYNYDDVLMFRWEKTPYFISEGNRDISLEFTTDVSNDCLTYGLLINNGYEKIHIVPYFTEEMIEGMDLSSLSQNYQLHLPYHASNEYGGWGWLDMFHSKKYKMTNIVPYKFNTWEDYKAAKGHARLLPKRYGEGIYPIE